MSGLTVRNLARSVREQVDAEAREEQAEQREMSLLRALTGNQALMAVTAQLEACRAELAEKEAECEELEQQLAAERARCDEMSTRLDEVCQGVDKLLAMERSEDDDTLARDVAELLRLEREERAADSDSRMVEMLTEILAKVREPVKSAAPVEPPPSPPAVVAPAAVLPNPPKRRPSRIVLNVQERDPNGMPSKYVMTPEY